MPAHSGRRRPPTDAPPPQAPSARHEPGREARSRSTATAGGPPPDEPPTVAPNRSLTHGSEHHSKIKVGTKVQVRLPEHHPSYARACELRGVGQVHAVTRNGHYTVIFACGEKMPRLRKNYLYIVDGPPQSDGAS